MSLPDVHLPVSAASGEPTFGSRRADTGGGHSASGSPTGGVRSAVAVDFADTDAGACLRAASGRPTLGGHGAEMPDAEVVRVAHALHPEGAPAFEGLAREEHVLGTLAKLAGLPAWAALTATARGLCVAKRFQAQPPAHPLADRRSSASGCAAVQGARDAADAPQVGCVCGFNEMTPASRRLQAWWRGHLERQAICHYARIRSAVGAGHLRPGAGRRQARLVVDNAMYSTVAPSVHALFVRLLGA